MRTVTISLSFKVPDMSDEAVRDIMDSLSIGIVAPESLDPYLEKAKLKTKSGKVIIEGRKVK